ncbi:JAB domain-containing protein [Acidaminobacter sp. JC074]|nr:JAB domain-containing protein [Acidaminobacter sp. JC074]
MAIYGPSSLSDAELLAIVLQSGFKDESALVLGQKVASFFESGLQGLSSVTVEELTSIKGIGLAKACQVSAAIELGKRVCKSQKKLIGQVKSPKMVADYFLVELKHENKEKFIVVFLNTKNIITSYEVISVGSLSASIVHPREVFNRAIKRSAASIILVHNHPSGKIDPSKEDHQITERLCKVAEIIGIKILDHLIVSGENYYSFKEMDLI